MAGVANVGVGVGSEIRRSAVSADAGEGSRALHLQKGWSVWLIGDFEWRGAGAKGQARGLKSENK